MRELDSQLERVRQMLYGMGREHQRGVTGSVATAVSFFFLLWSAGFLA